MAASDACVMPAHRALLAQAQRSLLVPLQSVVHQALLPPSGDDPHDYSSTQRDAWSCNALPDGLSVGGPGVQSDASQP